MPVAVRPIAAILTLLFVLSGCGSGESPALPEAGFRVAFESHNVAGEMKAGETIQADIRIKNISRFTWPSKPNPSGLNAVNLLCNWLDRRGRMANEHGKRTPLPKDLAAGEAADLKTTIQAPETPGAYTLEITLVQEGVAVFSEHGGAKLEIPVKVVGARAEEPPPSLKKRAPHGTAPAAEDKKKRRGERAATAPAELKTAAIAPAQNGSKPPAAGWSVQVGSFGEEKDAERLARKLRDRGYDAYVAVASVKGQSWRQVRVGRFGSRAEAERLQQTLRGEENLEQTLIAGPR